MCLNELMACPVVTAADVARDPQWLEATIVVLSNKERCAINFERAIEFGKRHGQPVIVWNTAILKPHVVDSRNKVIGRLTDSEVQYLYRNDYPFTTMFVRGE